MSSIEFRDNPILPGVTDLLLYVGLEYTVPQYLDEAYEQGVSKRISLSNIPTGLLPGRSNIYLWHAQAIPMVQAPGLTIVDLVAELQALGLLDMREYDPEDFDWSPADWLLPDDYIPPGTLQVTCALQKDKKIRHQLEVKYMIRWHGGVICSSPLGRLRYILKKGETELPEHLRPYAHLIDAVRVVRVDKDGNPLPNQDGGEDQDGED